jgi:hypothetical protein
MRKTQSAAVEFEQPLIPRIGYAQYAILHYARECMTPDQVIYAEKLAADAERGSFVAHRLLWEMTYEVIRQQPENAPKAKAAAGR